MPRLVPSALSAAAPRSRARPAAFRSAWRSIRRSTEHREAQRLARVHVRLRDQARQGAYASHVARALGHRDRSTRVEQVERVRSLEDHFVARKREPGFEQPPGFGLEKSKLLEELS